MNFFRYIVIKVPDIIFSKIYQINTKFVFSIFKNKISENILDLDCVKFIKIFFLSIWIIFFSETQITN